MLNYVISQCVLDTVSQTFLKNLEIRKNKLGFSVQCRRDDTSLLSMHKNLTLFGNTVVRYIA